MRRLTNDSDSVPRRAAPLLASIGAALLTPSLVFVAVPATILQTNYRQLALHEGDVASWCALFAVSSLAVLPLFLMAARSWWCRQAARLVLTLGLAEFAWLLMRVLLHDYRGAILPPAILETVLLLVAAAFAWRARFGSVCILAAVLACTQLMASAPRMWSVARTLRQQERPSDAAKAPVAAQPPTRKDGNVYHVIFDSFQEEVYAKLSADDPRHKVPGLTHYGRFFTNYVSTKWSLAALSCGEFYEPNTPVDEWGRQIYEDPRLWRTLRDNGVGIHLYPFYPIKYSEALTLKSTQELVREGVRAPFLTEADLVFLNVIPAALKNVLNKDFKASSAAGTWSYGYSVTKAFNIGDVNPVHFPYFSVLTFRELMRDEPKRAATGQYVFCHLMLPHPPTVVDRYGRYRGADYAAPPSLDGAVQAHEAALGLMGDLVALLKRLGRYEDATILFHADHGGWIKLPAELAPYSDAAGEEQGAQHAEKRTPLNLLQCLPIRTHGLLLAKLAGIETMPDNRSLVQMIDIAPTILTHFGLPVSAKSGIPLQHANPESERPIKAFWNYWTPTYDEPAVFSEYTLQDGAWRFTRDIRTLDRYGRVVDIPPPVNLPGDAESMEAFGWLPEGNAADQ